MRRALVVLVVILVGLLAWFVLTGEPDDPAAPDALTATTADGDGDGAGESPRERRHAGEEEPDRRRITREAGTTFQQRFPELGQDVEQDPKLGAIRGRVMALPDSSAKNAVLAASLGRKLFARVHVPPDGGFLLKNVEPSRSISLTAMADGFAPGGLDRLAVWPGETLDVGTVYLGAALDPSVDNHVRVLVRDPEGAPLADANVTATTVFYGAMMMLGKWEKQAGGTILRDTTDSTGEVEFDFLPPAAYDIFVDAKGYAFQVRQRVTVQRDTKSVYDFRMEPGLAISGRIVDTDGNGIAGARVGALRMGDFSNAPAVTSDDEGAFSLEGLGGGIHMVFVNKEDVGGKQVQGIAAGTTDLVLEIELASEMTIAVTDKASGEPIRDFDVRPFVNMPFAYLFAPLLEARTADGNFTFRMPNGNYGMEITAPGYAMHAIPSIRVPDQKTIEVALETAGVVHGKVVSKLTGEPIRAAEVYVKKGGFPPTKVKDQATVTDQNGVFVLDHLPARALSLTISHIDHTEKLFEGVEPGTAQKDGTLPTPTEFRLSSGGRIEGTVFDDSHLPMTGQTIEISSGFDMMASRNTTTDDDGRYVFKNVPTARKYTLSVGRFLPGRAGMSRGNVSVTEGGVTVVDFGAEAGGQTVTGFVRRGESAVTNVGVSLISDDGGGDMVQRRTDAEGRFTFETVQPGRYQVTVNTGASHSIAVTVAADSPPAEVVLQLPSGVIAGTVVDDATGDPLPAVYVDCERVMTGGATNLGTVTQRWAGNALTGEDGQFDFDDLGAGTYRVRGLREGYGIQVMTVTVGEDGAPAALTMRLGPAGTVTGFVRTATGLPVSRASLNITDKDGVRLFQVSLTESSSDGSYTQASLPPGTYTFTFSKDGYAPASKKVVVAAAGQNTTAEFTLLQGGKIDLTVRDGAGDPVAKALLTLLDTSGTPVEKDISIASIFSTAALVTDANGHLLVVGITPGSYTLRVDSAGRSGTSEAFEVFEGGSTPIEVTLPVSGD